MVDLHWKRIILSLENISRHPIAESLRRAWGPLPLLDVKDAREVPGQGVFGTIDGSHYQLQGSDTSDGALNIDLIREGNKVIQLALQDDAGLDVEKTLGRFGKDYELFIISGDHRRRVKNFGLRYGFEEKNLFGELSPNEKLSKLEEIAPDIYFGDGTNDLLALKKAPVSIAVSAASPEAQAASDILMFDSSFGRCDLLIQIAKATAALNHRNLAIAIFYNLAAGSAAVAGLIHPLGAAILMPIASFTLLGSTLWGTSALRQIGKNS
jgi:cation transport ATPase